MAKYVPSPSSWVADQVELYERTNGTEGTTLRETGLPVIIVTNKGNKTGAVRKTPLMRVADGSNYVLVASKGGAPQHPVWYHNLKADPNVEIRDIDVVRTMKVREVDDAAERSRLWALAVEVYQHLIHDHRAFIIERLTQVFLLERVIGGVIGIDSNGAHVCASCQSSCLVE